MRHRLPEDSLSFTVRDKRATFFCHAAKKNYKKRLEVKKIVKKSEKMLYYINSFRYDSAFVHITGVAHVKALVQQLMDSICLLSFASKFRSRINFNKGTPPRDE
jgi:hypothetical protein